MIIGGIVVQKHDFPQLLRKRGLDPHPLHEGVRDVDEWVKRVAQFAKANAVVGVDGEGYTLQQIEGDAFEHLVQCIIERHGHDTEQVDSVEVGATRKARTGIDLVSMAHDGKVHLHQCKFSRKPRHELGMREIRSFLQSSIRPEFGIRKTLWTTSKGLNSQVRLNHQGVVQELGIDWLRETLDGDESFWEVLYAASLGATPERKKGLIHTGALSFVDPDRSYQLDALETFKEEVKTNSHSLKGRYVYPTGSGKTLIEALVLDHQMDRVEGFSVHVVVAPRIALLTQLMREFRRFIGDRYEQIGFHSNDRDTEGYNYDKELNLPAQRKTTKISKVMLEVNRAMRDEIPLVIFSTYHSLWKLAESRIPFETMIADESQYCISKNYFESVQSLNANAKLYFTATERHSLEGERRNNNEEAFGRIFGEKEIQVLIDRKILVVPKLHLLVGNSDHRNPDIVGIDDDDKEDAIARHLVNLVGHIAKEQRKLVDSDLPAKTLFTCKRAKDVRIIVGERNLKKLKETVPDHAVFTISSDTGAKVDGRSVARAEFLKQLREHKGDALIFHHDILAEGIDVDGITGVAMLRKTRHAKTLQTIGRCLRPFKENPSLKPHAYISVPVIDGNAYYSDSLEDVVTQMLTGGLEVNVEQIEVKNIDPDLAPSELRRPQDREPDPTQGQRGFDLHQEELKDVEHRLKEIKRNEVREMVERIDEDLKEEEHKIMLIQEVVPNFVEDIFNGLYRPGGKVLKDTLTSCRNRHHIVERAWETGRIAESWLAKPEGKAGPARPTTPLRLIKEHVDELGDIEGMSALTFNIEYVPYLKDKGANVVLATRDYCEATRQLAESQVIETEYLTVEAAMENGLKFDIVIGNPPYQKSGGTGTHIWPDFVLDGLEMLKDDGKIAMIHPQRWRGNGRVKTKSMEQVRYALKNEVDIEWLSINDIATGARNFDAGTSYDMYVAVRGGGQQIFQV